MSIFDRFENAVEKSVNSAFSKVFNSGIKPIDIAESIKRSLDDDAQVAQAGRIVTPNLFIIRISPSDLDYLREDLTSIIEELQEQATTYATEHNYVLLGPIEVIFRADETVLPGQINSDSSMKRGAAVPATAASASPEHPIITINGHQWILTEPVTIIGRGSESDIVVQDTGVSRKHLEVRVTPTGVIATDLGSTNGTFVEGHRIDAATLLDGNEILIGRTYILFRTHPDPNIPGGSDD